MKGVGLFKLKEAGTCKRYVRSSANFKSVLASDVGKFSDGENVVKEAKPYRSIPGPKPLPFLGNTWRFIPYVGK